MLRVGPWYIARLCVDRLKDSCTSLHFAGDMLVVISLSIQ